LWRTRFFGLRHGTPPILSGFEYMKFEKATLVENSLQIAWDYLELTGEIDDGLSTRRFLLRHIEKLFAEGVRSRLLLSNRAIMAYQQLRRDRWAA
jgi:hypothetical protein